MNRPEYIKCILNLDMNEGIGVSLCGKIILLNSHFTSIDHAYYNNKENGRLLPCPDCVKEVIENLTKHHDVIVTSYENKDQNNVLP